MATKSELVTMSEAAQILDVSSTTMWRLVRDGVMPTHQDPLDRRSKLQARSRSRAVEALLTDLASGAYTLDCGVHDMLRIRDLLVRYEDLNLGFADASVIACAERHKGKVLTSDPRRFDVVARGEGSVYVLP
jgi:predicted nucleic acid-binding protein